MRNVFLFFIACAALVSTAAPPARATGISDISIALKTLPLLRDKIASPARVAIVYDPAIAASQADADGIKALFDSGLEGPEDLQLTAQLVAAGAALAGVKIVFIAARTPPADYAAVAAAAAAAGALTICTDIKCVASDQCVLGVTSRPRVEVYYSPAAAEKSDIHFASAFVMLAKQARPM